MNTLGLHSEPDTIPVWSGAFGYVVHGMQPVFVQLPNGRWANTATITSVLKVGTGLHIVVDGDGVGIPDAVEFWNSQTTTPGR